MSRQGKWMGASFCVLQKKKGQTDLEWSKNCEDDKSAIATDFQKSICHFLLAVNSFCD